MKNHQISSNQTQSRIHWIDCIEVIAIYFVVFYHCTIYSYDILSTDSTVTTYFSYYSRTFLSAGVPLFFFINGYLLFMKPLSLKKHMLKTIKLILLSLFWGLASLFILMFIKNDFLSLKDFLSYFWRLQLGWINHLWYIGALVCIYIFFPLLKQIYENNPKIFLYFTIVSAFFTFGNVLINEIATFVLSCLLKKDIVLQDFNFFNMFNPFRGIYGYSITYFCLGGIIHKYSSKIMQVSSRTKNLLSLMMLLMGSCGLFGIGILYSRTSGVVWDVVWNGYDTIFTLCNVIGIFLLCLNYKSENPIIVSISKNTLGIYFIHIFFIHITMPYILETDSLCNIGFNLIYSIVILFFTYILILLLKKFPFIKKFITL